jgi:ABC-2 type transport system ATP-binding protein
VDVLSVSDLSRTYGAFPALKNVGFRVGRGGITGLLGPNGAGKTTLLKVLTGYLAPTGGEARICGFDVLSEPLEVARRIGYLPENSPVDDEATVAEYLRFVADVRRMGPAARTRGIARAAEATGIADRLGQRIGTLSRGYRQRVGLAQAVLHEPELLILDEPTTGLDPNQIAEIRALIRELARRCTVLLSSHGLPEVQLLCDRVLILHQGALVADRPTAELTSAGHTVTVGLAAGKVRATSAEIRASLAQIPGVVAVRDAAAGDAASRFTVTAESDVREALFAWAVDHGHRLVELASERQDLADVFRRLTGTG